MTSAFVDPPAPQCNEATPFEMAPRRLRSCALVCLCVLATLPAALMAQRKPKLPTLVDEIAVELVNVDLVVTGPDGEPITGLTREDFDLRVGGKPANIAAFAEITASGATGDGALPGDALPGNAASGQVGINREERPYLLILIDGQSMLPPLKRRLVNDIVASLDALLERSRGMMVATLGQRLVIEQTPTLERKKLATVLTQIAERVPSSRNAANLLLHRIGQGTAPVGDGQVFERARLQARLLYEDIRADAVGQQYEASVASRQLNEMVNVLATLPGRSCVLMLSDGIVTTPLEVALRMWFRKYEMFAAEIGVPSVEAELARLGMGTDVMDVVDRAAANRVTFYVVAGDTDPGAGTVEFGESSALDAQMSALTNPKDTLQTLALGTGGSFASEPERAGHLVDTMLADLDHYYSLAFDPRESPTRNHQVRVRLRDLKGKVRHLQSYRRKNSDELLTERAFAALHLDVVANSLDLVVEVGTAQRTDKELFVVPLTVRVPIARLTLLPEADQHTGHLSLIVAALSDSGKASPPVAGRIPITIPNSDLLKSMSRSAGARFELAIAPGTNKIAVVLRDDVARTIATHVVVVGAGDG